MSNPGPRLPRVTMGCPPCRHPPITSHACDETDEETTKPGRRTGHSRRTAATVIYMPTNHPRTPCIQRAAADGKDVLPSGPRLSHPMAQHGARGKILARCFARKPDQGTSEDLQRINVKVSSLPSYLHGALTRTSVCISPPPPLPLCQPFKSTLVPHQQSHSHRPNSYMMPQ